MIPMYKSEVQQTIKEILKYYTLLVILNNNNIINNIALF